MMNIVVGYNDNPSQSEHRYICRFYQRGICRFGSRCRNLHREIGLSEGGNKSKVSERPTTRAWQDNASSPHSPKLSLATNKTSQKATTPEVGPSTSRSSVTNRILCTKSCGICLDTISEKKSRREQTFGLLPNCNHCFCFTCLMKWRQSKEFDFDVSKACPECRKPSDYVYPSKVWFELKEDKDMFISKEKLRMQTIDCRYFKKGSGSCPFGNTCLYLHALPDGKKMDVGPPKPRKRRTANFDENAMLHQILYWLNDEDLDIDDDDEEADSNFELDLDDPEIAMQYYDHNDLRRYLAIQRQFLTDIGSDTESEDLSFPWLL